MEENYNKTNREYKFSDFMYEIMDDAMRSKFLPITAGSLGTLVGLIGTHCGYTAAVGTDEPLISAIAWSVAGLCGALTLANTTVLVLNIGSLISDCYKKNKNKTSNLETTLNKELK